MEIRGILRANCADDDVSRRGHVYKAVWKSKGVIMKGRLFGIATLLAVVLLLGAVSVAMAGPQATMGQPEVTVNPTAGYFGQVFDITCGEFYPGDFVAQSFYYPNGTLAVTFHLTSDVNGNAACKDWVADASEPTGVYKVVVSGLESGEDETTFEILGAEFVPEPGSILLLGSGLMGLAGYAGLRYRGRRS
jgi:hypothetical protein